MQTIDFSGLDQLKVLIVDDVVDNIRVIGRLLKNKGIQVAPATSGEQALGLALAKKPDLILLDVQMPEMDGFEVCRRLKADPITQDIPVIFLTARSESEDIMTGFMLGAIDYITKPFNSDEVMIRIKNHLELKKSRDIIQSQNCNLNELNATKDKFFSIIAHDLKNPISNFRDITKVLVENQDSFSKSEISEYLSMLNNSADSLFGLLENLLEWSRSQRGIIKYEPVHLDFTYLANNVISLSLPLAQAKKIELYSTVPEHFIIDADVNMINTVLRNLVSNAIKFTDENGRIEISATDHEHYSEFSVSDSGVGISQENLKKLFHIAENFSTLGTSNEKGTGIGLILCKEFVDKHGGRIWAESEYGVGTKFSFTIPKTENICVEQ